MTPNPVDNYDASSLDGELFAERDLCDLINDESVVAGQTVYLAHKKAVSAADLLTRHHVFCLGEQMMEAAYDLVGEASDRWDFPVENAAFEELRQAMLPVVSNWLAEHAPINFWLAADVVEYVVTADDIARAKSEEGSGNV